jgi:hypothetical protein
MKICTGAIESEEVDGVYISKDLLVELSVKGRAYGENRDAQKRLTLDKTSRGSSAR